MSGRGRRVGSAALATLAVGLVVVGAGCSSGAGGEPLGQTAQAVDMICNESPGATLDGFPAYAYCGNFNVYTDNGIDTRSTGGAGWTQTEGGYGYQCVEWAVRYFYFKWNVTRSWFVPYAKDMCGTHPADVSSTNNPIHGDIAVFTPGCGGADATAGHVAAIDTVSASSIEVVQENPAGRYSWPRSCVKCYLHAQGNGGVTDPCATAPSSGDYCGQSTQWGGGTHDVLYDCQNGVTASKTPCPYGCNVAPAGTNDSCKPPPPDAGPSPGDGGASDGAHTDTGAGDAGMRFPGDAAPLGGEGGEDAGTGNGLAGGGSDGGGCAVGGRPARSVPWGLLLGCALLLRRRRRVRA